MTELFFKYCRWFRILLTHRGRGEFVVDMFAGGGGTSKGIEAALGRPVDIAINHDPDAIAIHRANHPKTYHFLTDVREVDPRKVLPHRPIGMLWLSPDCTHHSRAKGGKPVKRNRRALANVGIVWAKARRPRVIFLENVEEFEGWGPLGRNGLPDKSRAGQSFKRWVGRLRREGYKVEWRSLVAADYGAPTIRKRLFLVARCDGQPIVWPKPTHAPIDRAHLLGLKPWRAAAECIDWELPARSIFERKRPLAEATLRRIHAGVLKFVFSGDPFIVRVNHQGSGFRGQSVKVPMATVTASRDQGAVVKPSLIGIDNNGNGSGQSWPIGEPIRTITTENRHALVEAFLNKHFTGSVGQDAKSPVGTITGRDHHSLTTAFLTKFRGSCVSGQDVRKPMPTLTACGKHIAEVRAFLVKYFRTGVARSVRRPAPTLTSKHRLGLVEVCGDTYQIDDIRLRMLTPRELLRAQFGKYADKYVLVGTQEKQIKAIGNSVPPEVAEALVKANYRRKP